MLSPIGACFKAEYLGDMQTDISAQGLSVQFERCGIAASTSRQSGNKIMIWAELCLIEKAQQAQGESWGKLTANAP